jgi:hypothetical protein
MADPAGGAVLEDQSVQNHFAARYLNLITSEIPRAEQVPIDRPGTEADQLAAELALRYLAQRGLSQTGAAAGRESVSKISIAHRHDWPARILSLAPGGSDLGKLCRIRLASTMGRAVGRPRYRLLSDDGRAVIGCLVMSGETHDELWIEDEVGDADIDARLLAEMRRNAKMESQRDAADGGAEKVAPVGDVQFWELSADSGDDV